MWKIYSATNKICIATWNSLFNMLKKIHDVVRISCYIIRRCFRLVFSNGGCLCQAILFIVNTWTFISNFDSEFLFFCCSVVWGRCVNLIYGASEYWILWNLINNSLWNKPTTTTTTVNVRNLNMPIRWILIDVKLTVWLVKCLEMTFQILKKAIDKKIVVICCCWLAIESNSLGSIHLFKNSFAWLICCDHFRFRRVSMCPNMESWCLVKWFYDMPTLLLIYDGNCSRRAWGANFHQYLKY